MIGSIITCLLLLAAEPARTLADARPQVVPLMVNGLSEVKDLGLKEILEKFRIQPVNVSANPEMKPFIMKASALLHTLLEPKDGSAPIQFVLVDDARVNAAFFENRASGERVVFLNLGAVRFLHNDDELAHILAHELEHRTAQLQGQAEMGNVLDQFLFQRAVENEVDAKAATERLLKNGYNPYASVAFLERLDQHASSLASSTHSNTSSRKHTTGLALVYNSRELGNENQFRSKPEARRTEVTGEFKSRFTNHLSYKLWQRNRLKALIDHPGTTGIKEVFEKVKEPGTQASEYTDFYQQKFSELYRNAERLGADDLSPAELIEYQLALHRGLDQAFQRARMAALGAQYAAPTIGQMRVLQALDRRVYRVSALDLFQAFHVKKYAKLALEDELKKLAAEPDPGVRLDLEQNVKLYRKMYESAAKDYEQSKLPYVDAGTLDAKVTHLFESGRTGISLGSFPERLPTLGVHVKVLETTIAANAQLQLKTLRDHAPLVFSEKLPFHLMREQLETVYALKNRDSELGAFFDRLLAQVKVQLQKEAPSESGNLLYTLLDTWWRRPSTGGRDLKSAYLDLHQLNPSLARNFLRELGKMARDTIRTTSQLKAFVDVLKRSGAEMASLQDPELLNSLEVAASQVRQKSLASAGKLQEISTQLHAGIVLDDTLAELAGKPVSGASKSLWQATAARVHELYPSATVAQAETIAFVKFPELREAAGSEFGVLLPRLKNLTAGGLQPVPLFSLGEIGPLLDGKLPGADVFPVLASLKELLGNQKGSDGGQQAVSRDFYNGLLEWLLKNRREELSEGQPLARLFSDVANHQAADPIAGDMLRDYFTESYERILKRNAGLPPAQRIEQTIYQYFKQSPAFLQIDKNASYFSSMIAAWSDGSGLTPLGFLLQMRRGAERFVNEVNCPDGHPERLRSGKDRVLSRLDLNAEKAIFNAIAVAEKESTDNLIEFFRIQIKQDGASTQSDRWFDLIWERSGTDARYSSFFTDPGLVGQLHYDDNRLRLAKWQLDREFHLTEKRKLLRMPGAKFPVHATVRAELTEISSAVEKRIPDFSGVRNELLSFVQDSLLTTDAETEVLGKLKLGQTNWYESRQIRAIDGPQQLAKALDGPDEQLKLLRYLIGQENQVPVFRHLKGLLSEAQLKEARRLFQLSDVNLRTYSLQPLLDDRTGLLAHSESAEDLYRLILGEHYDQPLTSRIFRTYLEKLPPPERTAVLGRILAGMGGQDSSRATLKTLLEAMGPFGIKAGQFLRTSGILPLEYRMQLDDFFDNARPVDRDQMMARMKEVFGKNLVHVEGVGQIVGSGSVNFAVLADVKDPETGQAHRVVVRFLREAVEGQVRNENELWEAVIKDLRQDQDPAIRRAGGLLNEARSHAFENLRSGGSELDLERGRAGFAAMNQTYARPPKRAGKLALEVAPPVPSIQKLVHPKFAKVVSVQAYVPNIRFRDIPVITRREVAKVVAEAELRALFVNGIFDPDGHPGNWLYDELGNRVVRIDYDQGKHFKASELASIRHVFSALVRPGADRAMSDTLMNEMASIFRISGEVPGGRTALNSILADALQDTALPRFSVPHERLFFLQDRLQRELVRLNPTVEVHLQPAFQSALASVGRIAIYRETIGDRAFGSMLLESLGIHPTLHLLQQGAQSVRQTVAKVLTPKACSGFFGLLKHP